MEIILFIVGAIFSLIGGYVLRDARRFARTAVRGEGQVILFGGIGWIRLRRRKSPPPDVKLEF